MNEDRKFFLNILFYAVVAILLIIFIILLTLRIPAEANCEVTGISFQSNTTSNFQNLSMQDGSVHCKFKGEVPLIFFLDR